MQIRRDFRSKLIDGLAVGLILYLVTQLLQLLVIPFRMLLENNAGVLVYALGMLALSIYCLERALLSRFSDANRAWYGAVGGLLGWTVIVLSNQLGAVNLASVAGVITLIMVGLIISVFWRRKFFPEGAKFFSLTLLLNWVGNILLLLQGYVVDRFPGLNFIPAVTGGLAVLGALLTLAYIFFKSERRMQRIWCGVLLWIFMTLAYYSFRGWVM